MYKDVGTPLYTDHRRVQQILYNLVGNAIKYGGEGGNFVELSIDDEVEVDGLGRLCDPGRLRIGQRRGGTGS